MPDIGECFIDIIMCDEKESKAYIKRTKAQSLSKDMFC